MNSGGHLLFKILRKKVLDGFLERVIHSPLPCRRLMIVSPWITPLDRQRYTLEWIVNKLEDLTFFGVVTTEPKDEHHLRAMTIISEHPESEIIYNGALHAKLYVATFGNGERKLAMIGSANLTNRGNTRCEIGILFFSVRDGRKIIDGLEAEYQLIRTLPGNTKAKSRRR
jgi:hypothetical protein